jgi:hypothetical protein
MKLIDAVKLGRFCGLETVGECVLNAELNFMSMLPYSEIPPASVELSDDLKEYEAGRLVIDWDEVDKHVEAQHEEMRKSFKK